MIYLIRLFFIDSNLEVLHMARTDLEKLNGQFSLYYNGSYIVAFPINVFLFLHLMAALFPAARICDLPTEAYFYPVTVCLSALESSIFI